MPSNIHVQTQIYIKWSYKKKFHKSALWIERVQISNFKGPVLMNRKNEMGGVRVERMQYRRWGGNSWISFQDGGTPGSPSTTTSEGEWISGRWSPGGMEEKWRGKLLFSNSQQQHWYQSSQHLVRQLGRLVRNLWHAAHSRMPRVSYFAEAGLKSENCAKAFL